MHRIRHYKINGRLVWDRIKKVDTLTGSDQGNETSNGMKKKFNQLSFLTNRFSTERYSSFQ